MDRDHILQLYITNFSGNATAEEQQLIREKLRTDAAFSATWRELEQEGTALNVEDFVQRMDTQQALLNNYQRRRRRMRMQRMRMAAAAVVMVCIAMGATWYLYRSNPAHQQLNTLAVSGKVPIRLQTKNGEVITLDPSDSSHTLRISNAVISSHAGGMSYASTDTAQNSLTVPAGQQYKIVLSDGSEVSLNAATTFRFPFHFSGSSREVYLSGEAYFKIARDPQHPFIVHTASNDIDVLGTTFNINAYPGANVATSLTSGAVMVRNREATTQQLLKPGSQAQYDGNTFTVQSFEEEEVLAWLDGTCYYHHMNLLELADAASRFYGLQFTIANPQLLQQTFTGLMKRNSLEDFLSDLKITGNINYTIDQDRIILK
ncbi:FecR family protein [Chitinophaga jiangningensis]|uniref:FecR family protein n=1 Tax=Chitinophaga jiangningensis TaxID=1419482 RepID=A0A1M7LT89_9BACT|nr:FecR domain-containing protein [Chitinophaga jiangningensis]SHM81519.1 FecR family protein [Chitinophaga jiangningensis]